MPFIIGNDTFRKHIKDGINLFIGFGKNDFLLRRHGHVGNRNGDRPAGGVLKAKGFDIIQHFGCSGRTGVFDAAVNDITQLAFGHGKRNFRQQDVFPFGSVYQVEVLGDYLVENQLPQGSNHQSRNSFPFKFGRHSHLDPFMQVQFTVLIGHVSFIKVAVDFFDLIIGDNLVGFFIGQVIGTQYHVLGRNRDGFTVYRF